MSVALYINTNMKALRLSQNMSQEAFAQTFNLTRGKVASYEISTEPAIATILKIVNFFDIDINDFLTKDLSPPGAVEKARQQREQSPAQGGQSVPKVVVTDRHKEPAILQIDAKAAAGLPYNIDNEEFYQQLPTLSLPGEEYRNGTYIALQSVGDSMHPTIYHHDWLIARFMEDWSLIREGYIHIVVTMTGAVVKRLLNRLSERGTLVLQSDNESYPTYEEKVDDILQIYDVKAKLSYNLRNENRDLRMDVNYLKTKMTELQYEVDRLKRR